MDPVVAALLLLIVAAAAIERGHLQANVAAERDAWREERAELLERIQRPERPIRPAGRPSAKPVADDDERLPSRAHLAGAVMPPRTEPEDE